MAEDNDFRILIIDDNQRIHEDFKKILLLNTTDELKNIEEDLFGTKSIVKINLPKFKIDTASQGQEGVQFINNAINQGNPYALAFVDVRMPPGWDGIETIKHIWQIDPDIQIVICTAYSDYSWEETVEELGYKENLLILKKPFDNIAVRQLACALTKKWQLLQESKQYTQSLESSVIERTQKIQYQATHDLLTGLPNREKFMERVRFEISKSQQDNSKFAIFFLDLDRFKLINDSFGHAAGDELLKIVTSMLTKALPIKSMLARLGGDEIVALIPSLHIDQIEKIANSFVETLHVSHQLKYHSVVVSASVGISIYPNNGTSPDILLRNADMAMYHAKELGGNQYQFYTNDLNRTCLENLELESDLHNAFKNEEFFLVYQPQYDLYKKQVVSVEALVRWNHPTKGVILPINFIPIAENTGLINKIGAWVLETACKQNKHWQDLNMPPIRMAVNIGAQQFKQPNLVSIVKDILHRTQLDPSYLELELTENILLNHTESANKIDELRKMGIYIALDDFGTGYSSLNYIRHVPLDRLKIDKTFVQNIDVSKDDEVIIQAIIAMAKGLDLEVLAEGVETQNQLDFLKSKECGNIQGFYFSKPLTSFQVENLLQHPEEALELIGDNLFKK